MAENLKKKEGRVPEIVLRKEILHYSFLQFPRKKKWKLDPTDEKIFKKRLSHKCPPPAIISSSNKKGRQNISLLKAPLGCPYKVGDDRWQIDGVKEARHI